jgi:hypothetical protein
MTIKGKLQPYYAEIIEKYEEDGQTMRTVAEYIRNKYQVHCSHQLVGKIIQKAKNEKTKLAKELLRQKLAARMGSDVDMLDTLRDQIFKLTQELLVDEEYREFREQTKLLLTLLDFKHDLFGTKEPDQATEAEDGWTDQIIANMNRQHTQQVRELHEAHQTEGLKDLVESYATQTVIDVVAEETSHDSKE